MTAPIFKVLPESEWAAAQQSGVFTGSEVDRRDGFIHFSTADQLAETLAKHFAGQTDLVVLAVDPDRLDDLRMEPSRGGDLFPHLYGDLPVDAVVEVRSSD